MLIYPAIDLRGGRVVRLTQGDYDRMTVYGDDPVAVAQGFVQAGATCLHAVDLDGAKDGSPQNRTVIGSCASCRSASRWAAACAPKPTWTPRSPWARTG